VHGPGGFTSFNATTGDLFGADIIIPVDVTNVATMPFLLSSFTHLKFF
jgi:hypothetical protein